MVISSRWFPTRSARRTASTSSARPATTPGNWTWSFWQRRTCRPCGAWDGAWGFHGGTRKCLQWKIPYEIGWFGNNSHFGNPPKWAMPRVDGFYHHLAGDSWLKMVLIGGIHHFETHAYVFFRVEMSQKVGLKLKRQRWILQENLVQGFTKFRKQREIFEGTTVANGLKMDVKIGWHWQWQGLIQATNHAGGGLFQSVKSTCVQFVQDWGIPRLVFSP